ncbi:hypothetical protein RND71_021493 [Anisodus tanguticus]|uniref:Uncharacterized protein n=1 Tax=Anisodus tanguticus TaxID=243964 RepID=A0AAE1RV92_9SOLA|nr:hypothetical protein RND71_021493 [Anisodus tanguticus]
MAGCSLGIRLSHFTSLKNEIFIMGSVKDSNFMFVKNQDFVGMSKIGYLVCQNNCKSRFLVKSSLNQEGNLTSGVKVDTVVIKENDTLSVGKDVCVLDVDNGGDGEGELADGDGGNGKYPGGGGGGSNGGGGGDNGDGDEEEEEFGPLLKFEDVMREAEARGAKLPADMIEAAKSVGIRKLLLLRYLDLQGSAWLGAAMRSCAMLRNRMLADPSFLFKVGTEIVIDTTCATVAEVQKRGKDFWAEFELYAADMLVGVAVNVALVGLLAPYARIGQPSVSQGFVGRFQRAYGALPSRDNGYTIQWRKMVNEKSLKDVYGGGDRSKVMVGRFKMEEDPSPMLENFEIEEVVALEHFESDRCPRGEYQEHKVCLISTYGKEKGMCNFKFKNIEWSFTRQNPDASGRGCTRTRLLLKVQRGVIWLIFCFTAELVAEVGLIACGLGKMRRSVNEDMRNRSSCNRDIRETKSVKKSEDDVPVPPLVKSAILWGVFLGVSSNTRLQIVTGLERLVESSPMGKQFPPIAMTFTVGVRFANNIYAGMQFVDWARWSGVQ